jgi:hypothetical protein
LAADKARAAVNPKLQNGSDNQVRTYNGQVSEAEKAEAFARTQAQSLARMTAAETAADPSVPAVVSPGGSVSVRPPTSVSTVVSRPVTAPAKTSPSVSLQTPNPAMVVSAATVGAMNAGDDPSLTPDAPGQRTIDSKQKNGG